MERKKTEPTEIELTDWLIHPLKFEFVHWNHKTNRWILLSILRWRQPFFSLSLSQFQFLLFLQWISKSRHIIYCIWPFFLFDSYIYLFFLHLINYMCVYCVLCSHCKLCNASEWKVSKASTQNPSWESYKMTRSVVDHLLRYLSFFILSFFSFLFCALFPFLHVRNIWMW